MADRTKECSKCGDAMEEGFLPDFTHARILQQGWAKGIPRDGFLGIKARRSDLIAVSTYRCVVCGYLESFAGPT